MDEEGSLTADITLTNDFFNEREWSRTPATNPHWKKVGFEESMASPDDDDYVSVTSLFDSLGVKFTLLRGTTVLGTEVVRVDTEGATVNLQITFSDLEITGSDWATVSVRMEPVDGEGEPDADPWVIEE